MPAETTSAPRFDPTWAFGAAAASLACAFVGAHLVSTNATNTLVAGIATTLAALVIPGWLAVGVVLAMVAPDGAWPSARARALTILASIVLTLFFVVAIGLLLYLASPMAGIAFGVACVLALAFVDRALSAGR